MKKISILFLTMLMFNIAFTQENRANYNKWSLELNAGINKAGRNYTPGYSSALIGIGEVNFGARYMFNPRFGLDLKLGFDRFQDSKESPNFATNMGRIQLQGIANLGNVLNFYQWTEKFGLLAHFGVGVGDYTDSGFPLAFSSDKIGTVIFGLTPQVKLGNRWAVNFDASIMGVGRMHNTFDYKSATSNGNRPIDATVYTATFGVTYYIGKNEQHADWSPSKFVSQEQMDALKEDMAKMRDGMNDDDKDGVPNYLDEEPNSAEGMVVNNHGVADPTLTDTDKDGIADAYDKCPEAKGTFMSNGCPDSDNDGVADSEDKCPDAAGASWNNGCPGGNGDNVVGIKPPFEGVTFPLGSSTLTNDDKSKLDRAADILKANPNYKLVIKGHTDNIGEFDFNQELSEERANSGKNYLLKKGADPMQIQTVGYGYTKPLIKENTPSARSQNRRIELEFRN